MPQFGVAWADHKRWPAGVQNEDDPWWPLFQETPFDDADTQFKVTAQTGIELKTYRTRTNGRLYDPNVNSGHIVRVRANVTVQNGNNWKLGIQLKQGEGTLISQIDSASNPMVQGWFTYVMNVGVAEAGNITDYEDLHVRLDFARTTNDGSDCFISAIEIEIPDAAPVNGAGLDSYSHTETADGTVLLGASATDVHEMVETASGLMAPGRLVDRGRRFRMQRVIVDFGAAAVTINGRGR